MHKITISVVNGETGVCVEQHSMTVEWVIAPSNGIPFSVLKLLVIH